MLSLSSWLEIIACLPSRHRREAIRAVIYVWFLFLIDDIRENSRNILQWSKNDIKSMKSTNVDYYLACFKFLLNHQKSRTEMKSFCTFEIWYFWYKHHAREFFFNCKIFTFLLMIQARIAQLVAYRLGTRKVPGSNPGKGEKFSMKKSNRLNSIWMELRKT